MHLWDPATKVEYASRQSVLPTYGIYEAAVGGAGLHASGRLDTDLEHHARQPRSRASPSADTPNQHTPTPMEENHD